MSLPPTAGDLPFSLSPAVSLKPKVNMKKVVHKTRQQTPCDDALFPLFFRFREPLVGHLPKLFENRILTFLEKTNMVFPYRPLDQLRHRILVIRKDLWHDVEKVVVILIENDRSESHLRKERFETLGELALDFPVLCTYIK